LHGAWLLVFAALLPQALRLIPIASLAAVLVYTGFKLMNPSAIRKLMVYGKGEVAIYWATLVTVVVVDLLTGIAVGIGLAFGKLLYTFSHFFARLEPDPKRARSVLHLEGAATFVGLPKLASILEQVPPNAELHVHFDELSYIDHACLDLLMNWEKQHEAAGGSLVIDWESLTAKFRQPAKGTVKIGANGSATTVSDALNEAGKPIESIVRSV
jgi:MFS superfamily sulfate permease-like transporter